MHFAEALAWFLLGFLAMEPITALIHRTVMHGWGWSWHRDHHQSRGSRWERNDRYPIVFALVVGVLLIAGGLVEAVWFLMPLGYGITAYGIAYGIVHELAIHQRLGQLRPRGRWMRHLAAAHAEHHRTNGAPFGMLWPILRAPAPRGDGHPGSAQQRHISSHHGSDDRSALSHER